MPDTPRSRRTPQRRRALTVLPVLVSVTAAVFVVCAVLAALVLSGLTPSGLSGADAAPGARPVSTTESEGMSDAADAELRMPAGIARRSAARAPAARQVRTVRVPFPRGPVARSAAPVAALAHARMPVVPYPVRCVVLRC